MKRLYNEYEALNDLGHDLDDKIYELLTPVFDDIVSCDVDGRDAMSVVTSTVDGMLAERILRRTMRRKRLERNSEFINNLGKDTTK